MSCFCLILLFFIVSIHFSVPHTRSLETRIKEELVAQGLLDSEERPGPGGDSEDEVLAELQKRQAELKALSAHNRARKQELLRWEHRPTVGTLTWSIISEQLLTGSDLFFLLTGWQRKRCASRSWGRESGFLTMRWWRHFDELWQPDRRNALQQRRRRTRPGKHWRSGRAFSSYWMVRGDRTRVHLQKQWMDLLFLQVDTDLNICFMWTVSVVITCVVVCHIQQKAKMISNCKHQTFSQSYFLSVKFLCFFILVTVVMKKNTWMFE